MHAYNLVIELVVTAGSGQKRVSVRDEHVKEVHHLKNEDVRKGEEV